MWVVHARSTWGTPRFKKSREPASPVIRFNLKTRSTAYRQNQTRAGGRRRRLLTRCRTHTKNGGHSGHCTVSVMLWISYTGTALFKCLLWLQSCASVVICTFVLLSIIISAADVGRWSKHVLLILRNPPTAPTSMRNEKSERPDSATQYMTL